MCIEMSQIGVEVVKRLQRACSLFCIADDYHKSGGENSVIEVMHQNRNECAVHGAYLVRIEGVACDD